MITPDYKMICMYKNILALVFFPVMLAGCKKALVGHFAFGLKDDKLVDLPN